jgi:MFS family permease
MILLPLYYQSIRHQDPVVTGLLVAPTGIGVAIAMQAAARLTDRIGSGRTALIGGSLAMIGTIPFLFLGASTPYLWIGATMVVRGAGFGLCMIPAMAAIYRAVPPTSIGDATTQLNVLNRLGGSIGTAVFTVVLSHSLATGAGAAAYADAFRWVLGAAALAAIPAVFLIRAESRQRAAAAPASAPEPVSEGHR